ncbi:MAG: hypothetical protein AAFX93_08210 [Verrucomicrobiota bacterium]
MNLRPCCFSFILFCLFSVVCAAEPADSIIKNAEADLAKFEGQADGLTADRKSSVRRLLKLVNLAHERLDSSKNKDAPSWQKANERFITLKTRLNDLLTPDENKSTTSQAKPTASTSAAPSTSTTESAVRPLVSGERVRVKKLIRDINSVDESIVTTGPSPLQDSNEVAKYQKRIKQFQEALQRYPQLDDPDVQAARQAYNALLKKLEGEYNRARGQSQELGDVQARLATIRQNFNDYPAPKPLALPFDEVAAQSWVKQASQARTVADHNFKELKQIAPLAYLPQTVGTPESGAPFDASDLQRMLAYCSTLVKEVEGSYAATAQSLDSRLKTIESDVVNRWNLDPNDPEKRWRFIGKGQALDAHQVFDEAITMAQSSVYLESALNRDTSKAEAVISQLQDAKSSFDKNAQIALRESQLPKAASKDSARQKIAKEVLKNPDYEFGEFGTIVLTTPKIIEREKKHSELEIDDAEVTLGGDLKVSGTETTWTYKWEEFKFAVPLKESDSDIWYIWWITAKKYSSGGNRTPIGYWVSGKATQGNEILPENF